MHACPVFTVARSGTSILRAFYNTETGTREGVCMFESIGNVHACVSKNSRSVHACMSRTSGSVHACMSKTSGSVHACMSTTSGRVHVCVSKTSGSVHACVSKISGSVHTHVSETHISSTFPCTKRRKQSSAECCRHIKVIPIPRRSPFPSQTDTQTVSSAFFEHGNGDMHACLRRG